MKKTKIQNIILYIINFILVGFILLSNKDLILNNNRIILKNMDETTRQTDLNNQLNALNSSHEEFQNYIQISKQKIANAINIYPNNNATENDSLEKLSTMINNLTNIPENTYYYEKGTEGDSSTIIRYKKIGEEYYKCDEHGIVNDSTNAIDVSSLTLVPYLSTASKNLSSGYAGYASGKFYLGDGSDLQQNVTDSGYSKIIYLGENTTFNVSNYEGFENFTEENFIVMATNSSNNVSKTWYEASASTTVTKSYNKDTGVLNAYMTLNHSGYNKGNYDPDIVFNGSVNVKVGVYLVL